MIAPEPDTLATVSRPASPRPALAGALLIVAVLVPLLPAPNASGQTPSVACRRLGEGERVRVDGDLSDAAWQRAPWFSDFRQSVPHLGEAATEPTGVAFLLDEHSVYVAVRCDDAAPELIRANKLRHRDEPDTDDHVQVVFDTYRDQIRGTIFVVNPNGAREEGLVNGYQRYTWSWDEVWEAKAAITPRGWQVELAIPLRLLRYTSAAQQAWGVNVVRVIRRKQEEVYLAPPPPPYDISSLNFAGTLTGLTLGARQRNLQVTPYALGGTVRETDPGSGKEMSDTLAEVGVDLKYSLTSDLTLDATYNTDFAHVESDDEQVNLTRFSLFYPEKREFFLENAALFSFGGSGGGPYGASISPFFSRRIGIYEGETVPIELGLRLTGKVGREDIGVLSARTEAVGDLGLDAAWYNVARIRHDLGGRSYVGAIATDSRRGDFASTTLGVDAEYYLSTHLLARGYYLTVDDDADGGATAAYSTELDLTTDPFGFLFGFKSVDTGFDPDLGFVRRDGYREKHALLRRSIRIERWGIRRISFRTNNEWVDSLTHHRRESSDLSLSCELELENGDHLDVSVNRTDERLFEAFELDHALVFAPDDYTYDSVNLEYGSDESRRWGVDAEASLGEFYDADSAQLESAVWLVLSRHFRLAASYATYDISAPHGSLDWELWSARIDYIHSATLSASAYVQHNSSTSATIVNLRLRWILPNDSDVFVVLNERREEPLSGPTLRGRDAALKVSYRFFL